MMECSIAGAAGEEVFIAKETTKEAAGGTKILQTATESTPLQQQTHSIDPQDNDVVVVHNDAEETALTKVVHTYIFQMCLLCLSFPLWDPQNGP